MYVEISKGKLPDKYRNLFGIIRHAAHIGELPKLNTNKEDTEEYVAAENSKLWLIHNREGPEVLYHWDISFTLRECDVQEKKYTNAQDILIWPILKEAKGVELIERDFAKKFPESQNLFILEWNKFFPRILKLYEKKLTDQDSVYKELLQKDIELQSDDDNKLHPGKLTYLMSDLD